jgi:hypothetical protein
VKRAIVIVLGGLMLTLIGAVVRLALRLVS